MYCEQLNMHLPTNYNNFNISELLSRFELPWISQELSSKLYVAGFHTKLFVKYRINGNSSQHKHLRLSVPANIPSLLLMGYLALIS